MPRFAIPARHACRTRPGAAFPARSVRAALRRQLVGADLEHFTVQQFGQRRRALVPRSCPTLRPEPRAGTTTRAPRRPQSKRARLGSSASSRAASNAVQAVGNGELADVADEPVYALPRDDDVSVDRATERSRPRTAELPCACAVIAVARLGGMPGTSASTSASIDAASSGSRSSAVRLRPMPNPDGVASISGRPNTSTKIGRSRAQSTRWSRKSSSPASA